MNINKFTQKSIEALNRCEKIAYDYGNQEIDQEHFLYSLMTIEDSLIANLIEKMEINKEAFIKNIESLLAKKTKVSGNVQLYISNDLNKVLINAEDEAKRMGDASGSDHHLQRWPSHQMAWKFLCSSFDFLYNPGDGRSFPKLHTMLMCKRLQDI